MNNHIEYIGARYIPKYFGTWDKATAYEALSVVTFQGDSFTSLRPVPRGVEIADTEYWLRSGIFNAQLESIRSSVAGFDGRLDTVEAHSAEAVKTANEAKAATVTNAAAIAEESERAQADEAYINGKVNNNDTAIKAEVERAKAEEGRISGEVSRVEGLANANTLGIDATNDNVAALQAKFPIKGKDIDAGTITASKLAPDVVSDILSGLTVHTFRLPNDGTTGAYGESAPSGADVRGFYIEELQLLSLTIADLTYLPGTRDISVGSVIKLPNYIPNLNINADGNYCKARIAQIDDDGPWSSWYDLTISNYVSGVHDEGRSIIGASLQLNGIWCLTPYIKGVAAATVASYIKANQFIEGTL